MIFITRKTIIKVSILILIPILFVAMIIPGVSACEDLFYSNHLPDPKDMPDNWVHPILAVFSVPEKGCAIYVDLDTCTMTVYKDGKVYKTYPVSGGKTSTPSPIGTWKVVGKSDWGEGFGGSWIALNVPWGKYGLHGTVAPWDLGKCNASKGCIRMKNSDVGEVKRLVTWGTIVHIKQDNVPFRAVKNGKFGSDVLKVQELLKDEGYYNGGLDGKFGSTLEHAVKAFQKANEIYADGVVGHQTYQLMLQSRE